MSFSNFSIQLLSQPYITHHVTPLHNDSPASPPHISTSPDIYRTPHPGYSGPALTMAFGMACSVISKPQYYKEKPSVTMLDFILYNLLVFCSLIPF